MWLRTLRSCSHFRPPPAIGTSAPSPLLLQRHVTSFPPPSSLKLTCIVPRASVLSQRGLIRLHSTRKWPFFVTTKPKHPLPRTIDLYEPTEVKKLSHWPYILLGVGMGSFLTLCISIGYYYYLFSTDHTFHAAVTGTVMKSETEIHFNFKDFRTMLEAAANIPLIEVPFSLFLMGSSFLLIRRRAYSQWRNRLFLSRVSFSLNQFSKEGKLEVRTLFEKDLSQCLLANQNAMQVVQSQANKVTVEDPFLMFPRYDGWTIMNALLNEISGSVNPVGYFRKDPNAVHRWFIFGLTNEKDPKLFQSKLRVLLISIEDLEKISGLTKNPTATPPQLDNSYLRVRWRTLQQMARIYERSKDPNASQEYVNLGKVEIVL